MGNASSNPGDFRATRRFMVMGVAAGVMTLSLLVFASVAPIAGSNRSANRSAQPSVPEFQGPVADTHSLLTKVAGSRLIRPAQVQAAVKDTGAAQRLLERLKLQSVVNMNGEPVAYVRVNKNGVQSVRAGGRLLDFLVESVKPGEVKLSLDGVVVTLRY